jgi:hypothetical protein
MQCAAGGRSPHPITNSSSPDWKWTLPPGVDCAGIVDRHRPKLGS